MGRDRGPSEDVDVGDRGGSVGLVESEREG